MGPVVWLKVKSTQFKEIFIKTNQLLRSMKVPTFVKQFLKSNKIFFFLHEIYFGYEIISTYLRKWEWDGKSQREPHNP